MLDFEIELNKAIKEAGYADVRVTDVIHEKVGIENSNISVLSKTSNKTYGVRVFFEGSWGFSSVTEENKVSEAFKHAIRLAKLNSKNQKDKFDLEHLSSVNDEVKGPYKTSPEDIELSEKVSRLKELNNVLSEHKKVSNRTSSIYFATQNNFFQNSSGARIKEKKSIFDIRAMVVGKENGNNLRSFERIGRSDGYDYFKKMDLQKFGKQILSDLDEQFVAKKAPAGNLPVLMDNDLAGVFFHEAVGHACEADAVLEKSSVLMNQQDQRIAPEFLTLEDDPHVEHEHGYFKYDDEGVPAKKTVLIDEGILKGYMHSIETASRMDCKPTGNGRAQNASMLPIPRMTNTIVGGGNFSKKEIIEDIDYGIYALGSSGGVVEPANGNFLFNAQKAYLVEKGKIKHPLKDVSFGGNILDILQKVSKVGNDVMPTFTGGICGKGGQRAPVGTLAPHLFISEAMVGGTNK